MMFRRATAAWAPAPPLVSPWARMLRSVVVVAVVGAAAALGWICGGLLEWRPAVAIATPAAEAAAGPLRLDLDPAWTQAAPAGGMAVRGLRDLHAYEPIAGLRGRAWVARAAVDGPTLLPAGVRARLAAPLPAPQPTRLAGRPAWRYPAARTHGGLMLELTVQPTAAGVLIVGCEARRAWWTALAGCASGVLSVAGAAVLPPHADMAFRRTAPAVLAALHHRRVAAGRALRAAHGAREQHDAARRLSTAHQRAAARLAPRAPTAGPAHAAVARLRAVAAAYADLAHAAGRHRRHRYAAARAHAKRSDARLRAALARALRPRAPAGSA